MKKWTLGARCAAVIACVVLVLGCGAPTGGEDAGAGGGGGAAMGGGGGDADGGSMGGGGGSTGGGGGSTGGGGGSTGGGGGSTGGGGGSTGGGGGSTGGGGGSMDAGVPQFAVSNFEVRPGGCTSAVAVSRATVELRENLQNLCLVVTGTGLADVTGGSLRGSGGDVATVTAGSRTATTLNLVTSLPANILEASAGQHRFLQLCLTATSGALGCVPGVEITPIAASPSGQAAALGTVTAPLPSLEAALATAGPGSTVQVMGPAPWGSTDALALPAGAALIGGVNSVLDGASNSARRLALGAGSRLSRLTIKNFTGTALSVSAGTQAVNTVTLESVTLEANGTSLDINGGAAHLKKGAMDDCVLKDGTGTTGVHVRGASTLLVEQCTLSGNRGDGILVEGGSSARLSGTTGTSHAATSGTAGDDDAYLTLNGGTAVVVSSAFAGSARSAIVVKGTANTLTVAGGTTFTNNGTMNQSYCAGIALLGDGTTRVDRSEVMSANVFTDSCVGVYRAPTAANTVTVEDSQFVRTFLQFEGNLANVTVRRSTVTNAPGAAAIFANAPDTGPLGLVTIVDTVVEGAQGHGVAVFGKLSATVGRTATGACSIKSSARSGLYAARSLLQLNGCTIEDNGWWGVALENMLTPRPLLLNAIIRRNGADTAVSAGGVLVRNSELKLEISEITANTGYGVRTDAQGTSLTIPVLVLDGAGPISGNTGSGIEATAGTVTFTNGPSVRTNGAHGIHLAGATTFVSTGLLTLDGNAGDGLRIERPFGASVSVQWYDIKNNAGAGLRLAGGPGSFATTGAVTLSATGISGTPTTSFAVNGAGHVVDDQPPSLTTPLNVQWAVTLDGATATGPEFVKVGSRWTQVNINGATLSRGATPSVGTIVSARFGAAAPSTKTIKLSGTITQNGAALTLPVSQTCGGLQTFLPATGTNMAPFLDLNGANDCVAP